MNKPLIRHCATLILTLGFFFTAKAQNDNYVAENAYPFCDTSGISFPGGVNVPDAFPFPMGCLETSPNPAWFYFRVDKSGDLIFTVNSTPARDIDFIAWGPFTNLNLGDMTQYNEQNQIDCSYSGATAEQIDVPNAQLGDYYVVLITNYSNSASNINFQQTGGDGSTDCNLLIGSSNSPICEGQKLKLLSTLNPELYTFEWTGPNGYTSSIPNPEIPDAGIERAGTYRLIVSDPMGKKDTVFVEVKVTSIARPIIVGDACVDQNTLLSVSGGPFTTYTWKNGFTTIGDGNDSITVGLGTYTVRVTSANGCFRVSEPFTVKKSASVEIEGMTLFCEGESLLLKAVGNFVSYSWKVNGVEKSTSDSLRYLGGQLVLIATNSDGCTDTVKANVNAAPQPTAAFTFNPPSPVISDDPIQFTDQSTITSGGSISSWKWYFSPPADSSDEQNPLYKYPTTGQKQAMLIVKTIYGCTDTVIVDLMVTNVPFVPNSFSPNGDGKNDLFVVPYLPDYKDNQVVIFNRWGKKVFDQKNYQNDWDGGNLPTGTYFYVVSAPSLNDPLKGTFMLFRD